MFSHGDGVFIRTGECCRCGECCQGDPFLGEMGEPEIEGACPLLTLLPDGLHACSDREHPYYLSGCNIWPSHPDQISDKPSCTYKFERVSDGR
jgi:hypothetical protein